MSNQYYDQKWKDAINDIVESVKHENLLLEKSETNLGKIYGEAELFIFNANLYLKYIDSYKKLEDCYDQLVHPQKRTLLKEMLENTMVRIAELKNELIQKNTHHNQLQSDFINLDELLMDLKLLPESLEFILPRFFREIKMHDERNQAIDKLLIQFHDTSQPEEEVVDFKFVLEANLETAIRIIQKNERGRQGIEYALKLKYKKKEELKKKKNLQQGIEISEENTREEAIMVIQKYYRGYKARETVDKIRQDELLFLGMKREDIIALDNQKKGNQELTELDLYLKRRRDMKEIKKEHLKEYQEELIRQKELLKINEGADIKESKLRERRECIEKYRELNNYMKYPENIKDLDTIQNASKPLSPEEEEAKRLEEESKAKEEAKKKQAAKSSAGNKKPAKKDPHDEFMETHRKIGPTEIVKEIQKNIKEYNEKWSERDIFKNFSQKHEVDYAKEKVRPEVENEIKEETDAMIEVYLANFKTSGKANRKSNKPNKPDRDRSKKIKLPGLLQVTKRDPKDLLAELVEAGIVKKLQPAKVDDLLGEADNLGCLAEKQMQRMPDPSYQQLRQNIRELIGFPLGSLIVRQKTESKPDISFLFYGPSGTGKTLMVRALAWECDAMVIDLSATNLENKYMDKESTKKLIAMTFVVAKNFQPALIYIDESEMVHPGGGKKKKVNAGNAARIKKLLSDYKNKFLNPREDRVVIIGCTNKPYECNMKEVKSFYNRKLYFPFPNYATRKLLFKNLILSKGITLPDSFSLSTMAQISEGYTAGSFKMAIDKVLTERRIIQLKERPLNISEFLAPLSSSFFTSSDIYTKMIAFTEEATGLKERRDRKNNPQTEEDPKKNKGGKKK